MARRCPDCGKPIAECYLMCKECYDNYTALVERIRTNMEKIEAAINKKLDETATRH